MEGSELRYSQRLHLLRRAQHHGVGRFDANLIIAMVQHRMGLIEIPPAPERTRGLSRFTLVTAAVTQLLIVAAVWWLVG